MEAVKSELAKKLIGVLPWALMNYFEKQAVQEIIMRVDELAQKEESK